MKFEDNGTSAVLDLHRTRVDDTARWVNNAVRLCSEYGRTSLKIIHGTSTSETAFRNRTIKHALYDLLDAGTFRTQIHQVLKSDSFAVLIFSNMGTKPKPARINPFDVFR